MKTFLTAVSIVSGVFIFAYGVNKSICEKDVSQGVNNVVGIVLLGYYAHAQDKRRTNKSK